MHMTKRKLAQTLWYALQCAKDDRQGLVDAYSGDTKEDAVRNAMADIKAFESLQLKLFGRTKSRMEEKVEEGELINILSPIGIARLKELIEENPELPDD